MKQLNSFSKLITAWCRKKYNFTIIELLIVITIFLILVALLLPVIYKVKKKSQNTLCVSNLRQSSMAILSYASNSNTFYPRRSVDSSYWSARNNIRYNNSDDRYLLEEYIDDWRVMNCSFTEPDLKAIENSNAPVIQLSYEMYFGSYIRTTEAKSGLLKVGDVSTYSNNEFSILMTDQDLVRKGQYWRSSHPDYSPEVLTYRSVNDSELLCVRWRIANGRVRSLIDRNFLREDGSVFSMTEILPEDERLVELSHTSTKINNDKVYLPADE